MACIVGGFQVNDFRDGYFFRHFNDIQKAFYFTLLSFGKKFDKQKPECGLCSQNHRKFFKVEENRSKSEKKVFKIDKENPLTTQVHPIAFLKIACTLKFMIFHRLAHNHINSSDLINLIMRDTIKRIQN